jgi:hypothetical protein
MNSLLTLQDATKCLAKANTDNAVLLKILADIRALFPYQDAMYFGAINDPAAVLDLVKSHLADVSR